MNKKYRVFLGWIVLALLLVFSSAALAGGGGYDVRWSVIGGGGGIAVTEDYRVESSIGQGVTGQTSLGGYDLGSGFWHGMESIFKQFLPLVGR